MAFARHEWVTAPFDTDEVCAAAVSRVCYQIDAHRNLRGPYTAAASLVRALIDGGAAPDLVATHLLTLLLAAPELLECVHVPDHVRQAFTVSREGDAPIWTTRIAHGVTDFILAHLARMDWSGRIIVFTHVDAADRTDQQLIAVLLRRADPRMLRLRVCALTDRLDAELADALDRYAERRRPSQIAACDAAVPIIWRRWFADCGLDRHTAIGLWREIQTWVRVAVRPPRSGALEPFLDSILLKVPPFVRSKLARAYVNADGTAQGVLARHAYVRLPPGRRKALHLARASQLAAVDRYAFTRGAIPFHHDRAGGDATPLLMASTQCMRLAYYDAALDWSMRGRRMLLPAAGGQVFGDLTRNMLFALLFLGRYDEVDRLCAELLSTSCETKLLAHVTYAMAIMNARYYECRDYDAARAWIEKSMAYTERLPVSPARTVNIGFLMNTLALVETRTGRPEAAEQKLIEAIECLARAPPNQYRSETVILLWRNMARLHVATGRPDDAVRDLTTLLDHEPSDSTAWFDRGLVHQRAGRHEAALADYDAAIRRGPPLVEAHFNRAQVLVALERHDDALAEYDRALLLDPDFVEARIDRACLLYERRNFASARDDLARAILLWPGDARLLCLQGLFRMNDGMLDEAACLFTQAIKANPKLADPWANRAIVWFERDNLPSALADITQALELREDAAILYNRGRILETQHRWQEAADDYSRALSLKGGDTADIRRHLDRVRNALRRFNPRSPHVPETRVQRHTL